MNDLWIVVADGKHARVFTTNAEMDQFLEVHQLANHQHMGAHRRHPAGGHDPGHHATEEKFAREVGAWLDVQANQGHMRELILIAAPRFLGSLRHALGPAQRLVSSSRARDLDKVPAHELPSRLRELLDIPEPVATDANQPPPSE